MIKPKQVIDICKSKAPEILTGINIVGVGITAWLAGRAALKAKKIVDQEWLERREREGEKFAELTKKEELKLTWRCYVLPVVSAAATAGAAVASNRISAKRLGEAVAIGALYADRVKALEEKIESRFGKEESDKIKQEMKDDELLDIHDDKMLCYEPVSKQFFNATHQELLMAEITANKMFKDRGKLTLNQWLRLLPNCKPRRGWGDMTGWWDSDKDGIAELNWKYYKGAPWIDIAPKICKKGGKSYLQIGYGLEPMMFGDNQPVMDKMGREDDE